MTKPAIVIGEDIPQVLQKLKHDLEAKYSDHYRLIEANSGQQALDCLKQMSLQNEPVALLLVLVAGSVLFFYGLATGRGGS